MSGLRSDLLTFHSCAGTGSEAIACRGEGEHLNKIPICNGCPVTNPHCDPSYNSGTLSGSFDCILKEQ